MKNPPNCRSPPVKGNGSSLLNTFNSRGSYKTPTFKRSNDSGNTRNQTYNIVTNDDKSSPFEGTLRKRSSPVSSTFHTPSPLTNDTMKLFSASKGRLKEKTSGGMNPHFLFEEKREKIDLASANFTGRSRVIFAFLTLIFITMSVLLYISINLDKEISKMSNDSKIKTKEQQLLRNTNTIPLKSFSKKTLKNKPRIVHYPISTKSEEKFVYKTRAIVDPMSHVSSSDQSIIQDDYVGQFEKGECIPSAQWQVQSYTTCNSVHEINLRDSGQHHKKMQKDDKSSLLGHGWFRHTWKLTTGALREVLVIKTLRLERDFLKEYYDLHRKDAVAMERLTASPYVMNVYGYCGQTAINEFAHFMEGYSDFEDFAKRVRGKNGKSFMFVKLQIATMIALGLNDIHDVGNNGYATMVHYDINPKNIELTESGFPKINDFNVAEFLGWNEKTGKPCGFKGRFREPWWRSPEEMIRGDDQPVLDEKVDVYALGNVLYTLLTGHSPRGRSTEDRINTVRKELIHGNPPPMSSFYKNSKDTMISAMRESISLCLEPDPKKRASSREVATFLYNEFRRIKATMGNLLNPDES